MPPAGVSEDALIHNQVDAALRQEIETHLKACKRCWVLTDSLRKTLRIITCQGIIELPAGSASG